MITQLKPSRYGYLTRMLALPLSVLLFCAIALYAKPPGNGGEKKSSAPLHVQKLARPLTVLVDAGHGGKDDGATNQQGLLEKDLALSIAQKIRQEGSNFNIEVVLTRNDDAAPSLQQRVELAKSVNAAMIISIHVANSDQSATEEGFDIFVTNRNQKTMDRSRQLGQNISNQIQTFYKVSPVKQRKEKGIYILDAADCPAVLIECGYLSNQKDVAFVTNGDNQAKIAKAILQGIVSYQEAGVSYTVVDTVPAAKKSRDNAGALADKGLAETRHALIEDSITEVHKRKALKLEQKKAELQAQHESLNRKQQETAIAQQKLEERKVATVESQQKQLAARQQDLQEKREVREEMRQVEINRQQEKLNEKSRESQGKMDDVQRIQQKLQEEQLRLEKKLQVDLQKQRELDVERLKNLDLKIEALDTKQQVLLEKQKQVEIEHKKRIELQMKELDEKKIELENERRLKEESKENRK